MTAMIHPWPDHRVFRIASRLALFRGMRSAEMRSIQRKFTTEKYRDGETLACKGVDAPFMGIVRSGMLREDRPTPQGRTHLLALTFANEALAPLGCVRAKCTLTAVGETEVMTCDQRTFEELASAIPRLQLNLLHLIQDQLAQAQDWQLLLGRKTASERVASMLVSFHQRHGRPDEMHLPMSRADLGQLTGLTLETVSRQMRALEKAGLIAMPLPTRVRVLDAVALHELTGDAPARVAA